jgi:TolB-like protein/DNA-binding winged helix-turn-helix (wHTH) protein/Flp pilus assembly protein TadD
MKLHFPSGVLPLGVVDQQRTHPGPLGVGIAANGFGAADAGGGRAGVRRVPAESFDGRDADAAGERATETGALAVQRGNGDGETETEAAAPPPRGTYFFGRFALDLDRLCLRDEHQGGAAVELRPKSFDLLRYMVENADRLVSRDELMEAVWPGIFVTDDSITQCVKDIRRALGDEAQRLLRTVPKRGFVFAAETSREPPGDPAGGAPGCHTCQERARPAVPPVPAPVRPGFAAAGRPSIAVRPFVNLGEEPDAEYFGYGLAEDIIRLLALNRWLTVLSRHSAFPERGRDMDARGIATALGVRYLVQGSVRRRGERVRIAAELVGAESGCQIWSDTHDLNLPDIFEVQEAMARQIAAAIEPELGCVEREAAIRKPPGNLDAWDCYQRGLWHLWGFTAPGLAEAEGLFRRAIALEPGLARAHGGLSYVKLQRAFDGHAEARPALLGEALAHGRRAVALDDRDCMCHCALGRALCASGNYEDGIAALELSIALNPSFAQGHFALGSALVWSGHELEALALIERATELSPRDPHLAGFHHARAMAHFSLGELDSAVAFLRKATRLPNATHWPFAALVAALGLLGRSEEARPFREELLRRRPDYGVAAARSELFFCPGAGLVERFGEGLRLAGVPE